MIWLFMAVWMNGQDPSSYKIVARAGPFQSTEQCYAAGALGANAIQSQDDISNALGACIGELPIIHYVRNPTISDMKMMWDMVCAMRDKDDLCWLKNGQFVDPLIDTKSE
jgi:hypothetical protein